MNMETTSLPPARGRGRPPSITHARIADAGIALGLRNITFVGKCLRVAAWFAAVA